MNRIFPWMTEKSEAQLRLSMAVSESKYLGKWLRGQPEALELAKAQNRKEQKECRDALFRISGGKFIIYPKQAPTLGNRFRVK